MLSPPLRGAGQRVAVSRSPLGSLVTCGGGYAAIHGSGGWRREGGQRGSGPYRPRARGRGVPSRDGRPPRVPLPPSDSDTQVALLPPPPSLVRTILVDPLE